MSERPSYDKLAQRVHELEQADIEREKAVKALKESEERFRLLYKNAPLSYQSLDQDGRFIEVNQAWLNTLGYLREEVVGKSFGDFLHPDWKDHFKENFPRFQAVGEILGVEFEMVKKNGAIILVSFNGKIGRDNDGNFRQTHCIFHDITERQKAQEALQKSEAKFRTLFEHAAIGVAQIESRTGRFVRINQRYCDIIGYTPDEMIHKSFQEIIHPDDLQKDLDNIQKLLDGKTREFSMEKRYFKKNGSIVWVNITGSPMWEVGQEPDYHIAVVQDITERKQAETSLKAIEWLLNEDVMEAPLPSQPYGDLTALNTERVIVDNVGREVLADIVGGYLELLETSAAVYERNGDYAHGIFSSGWCQRLDSASRALCNTDDDAEALASGKWLCHESCWKDATVVAMQTGEAVDVACNGGLRIYAVPIEANNEIVGGINFGYGDPPKNKSKLMQIGEKYKIDSDDLLYEANRYEIRPPFIIEIAKKRLQSSAKLIGALIESRLSQNALENEREQLKVTLKSIGDGVITTDTSGNVVLMNKMAETLTGWTQNEAVGRKLDTVFHIVNEENGQRCENPVEKVLETNGIVGLANNTLLVARDGTERVIADSGSPIVDSNENTVGVVLVFRDNTEKMELESELRQAHKMEAVGHLAGGIAHEFNNVLGIIIGNTELAIDELETWHPVRNNLSEIKLASMRATDVVKQLLSFSRKAEIKLEPINIKLIVKETLKLLKASIPSDIQIQELLSEQIDTVVADPTQIHQLLINLCNNAAHAMSEKGGRLKIELRSAHIDSKESYKHPDLVPGAYVRLSVSDTGHGIPENLKDKIFDPYFTTKDVSKGTGMGLAVVHGIVKTHDGVIIVDSDPGKGTVFHIYFPSSGEAFYKKEIAKKMLPVGSEKILFVDDEVSIAKLCSNMLSQLGYTVVSETDPVQLLKRFQADPYAYDLVISDMTMPEMTGDRLASELLKLRDNIPIIICTGYSAKMSSEKARQLGISGLLMKPVVKTVLANTVRKVLDQANTHTQD